eukprot:CAMPEP_0179292298 /NCGR_PEP_ID=MMETSP0797-20121207/42786_1 /TAXON_ID=47934 /ORGANISM="Dinophysis acuminata, Strain DAEP01" /LENGTH=470 /DNA_ID=CAMNT_0021001411 /DNA_START=32 /DNA_END=1441 /DNA_ORIENTATION=+
MTSVAQDWQEGLLGDGVGRGERGRRVGFARRKSKSMNALDAIDFEEISKLQPHEIKCRSPRTARPRDDAGAGGDGDDGAESVEGYYVRPLRNRSKSRIFSVCTDRCQAPRLVDRQATFHQSFGRLKIRRVDQGWSLRALRLTDPFHSLVNMRTFRLVCLCNAAILVSWTIAAVFFYHISERCGLGADTFRKAMYISIQTLETIGYGVPDPYYHSCPEGILVLGASALWKSLSCALLISLVYSRISRPTARSSSVCFSEKAVISEIDGEWYLMFQVCDFRKHQLCEAHLRMYSIQHTDVGGVCYQTRAMRVQHPDDELGGMLLPALPQLVVHRVDPWSPLWPPDYNPPRPEVGTPANSFRFPEVPQRAADGENGNRDIHFGNHRHNLNHETAWSHPWQNALDELSISEHLGDTQLEFLCILEGIDPSTSATLQCRHSYTCDDIVFNAGFQKCVHRAPDGTCEVDFGAFHEL